MPLLLLRYVKISINGFLQIFSFFNKLAINVVVTPCIRAADERTGRELMDENQDLSLRMNDQCDSRNFCVVLTKQDDIEWKLFMLYYIIVGSWLEEIEYDMLCLFRKR